MVGLVPRYASLQADGYVSAAVDEDVADAEINA
jgi:hypothetical protein